MREFAAMTDERLGRLVSRFPSLKVAVVGDFFLDKYLDVDAAIAETSVETGRTAHQVTSVRHSPGAAGTVVSNLSALGTGELFAVGYTGDDGESYDMRKDLSALRCSTEYLAVAPDRMTPTYLKPRYRHDRTLAGEHNRYDTKNRSRTPAALEAGVLASIECLFDIVDAFIVADQVQEDDFGVVTAKTREALAALVTRHPKTIVLADSRTHIRLFRGVMIKPNQFEAVGRNCPMPGEVVALPVLLDALAGLRKSVGAPIFVTRGPEAMVVTDPAPTTVPGVVVEGPIDTTGAGDATAAGIVLALAAGAECAEAALVGNLVASITIQQLATTGTARPEELGARLELWRSQRS